MSCVIWPSPLRWYGAIAQDEVREDREHGATRRALETPDDDATQTDPDIMRVARQAPSPITGRLVLELEAQGEEEGEHTFDKGLAVLQQAEVGRVVSKIDGDGAVVSRRFGCCAHRSPPDHQVSSADETQWG